LEAEARERADKLIQEAQRQADEQVSEMERRTVEEVRRVLGSASALRAAAE
jgi:vacuolar-type H+-ATPase subunit H